MPNKKALGEFHKETIIAAADSLFLRKGVEGTTVDDIAKEAQYSKATLYVYFKSKEEIFHHIVRKGMQLLHERFSAVLSAQADTLEAYYGMCNVFATYAEEYPLYFQGMMETIAVDADSMKTSPVLQEIYQAGEKLNDDVAVLMRRGIENDVWKTGLSGVATGFVFTSAITGIVLSANKKEDYIKQRMGMDKAAFLNFAFDMLLDSLRRPEGES